MTVQKKRSISREKLISGKGNLESKAHKASIFFLFKHQASKEKIRTYQKVSSSTNSKILYFILLIQTMQIRISFSQVNDLKKKCKRMVSN
jgi:hypothetical protein